MAFPFLRERKLWNGYVAKRMEVTRLRINVLQTVWGSVRCWVLEVFLAKKVFYRWQVYHSSAVLNQETSTDQLSRQLGAPNSRFFNSFLCEWTPCSIPVLLVELPEVMPLHLVTARSFLLSESLKFWTSTWHHPTNEKSGVELCGCILLNNVNNVQHLGFSSNKNWLPNITW